MTGERIVFCVLAIIALCFPMRVKAQALPELPSATVSELHLVNQQAGDLAFNMNGVKLPSGASSILILNGIYKTMQAFNEWVGGDDYIVQRAYYLERQNMPEWLAEYSGDYIFWEISFFGSKITMITDPNGDITLTPTGNKALNVAVNENMDSAVKMYKVMNGNTVQNMPIPQSSNWGQYAVETMQKPYIVGKSLYFYVYIQNEVHLIQLQDFTNCLIGSYGDNGRVLPNGGGGVYMPCFYPIDRSVDTLTFIDMTTNTVLSKHNYICLLLNGPSGYRTCTCPEINGQHAFALGSVKWYLPGVYVDANYGTGNVIFDYNKRINGYGYAGTTKEFLYFPNNGGAGGNPSGLTFNALFLEAKDGIQIEDNEERLPIVNSPLSYESIEEIQDAISIIQPVIEPTTGIEIIEIPQNFPLPESVPLELNPEPSPIPGGIEDFPQSDPEIAPPYDPSIQPGTTPTEDTLPDSAEEIQPMEELQLVTGLQNRFPFSIPWDIYNAYKMLQAEREIPHWEWEMSVNLPEGQVFTHTFVLDLEFIDPVVGLFRDLFLLAFILGLAIYSYNKFFGGGA